MSAIHTILADILSLVAESGLKEGQYLAIANKLKEVSDKVKELESDDTSSDDSSSSEDTLDTLWVEGVSESGSEYNEESEDDEDTLCGYETDGSFVVAG